MTLGSTYCAVNAPAHYIQVSSLFMGPSAPLGNFSAYWQLGILPYAGVDIAAFEIFKERLLEKYDSQPPPILILGAGMLSSSIAQFASYPLALVRTRLQVQQASQLKIEREHSSCSSRVGIHAVAEFADHSACIQPCEKDY